MHDRRVAAAAAEVVAVEADVEVAERDVGVEQVAEQARAAARRGRAPRRWMPTIASGVGPRRCFSTISCAMRTSVRRMSSPSRTTFS